MRLRQLVSAWNAVQSSVFQQLRPGLMKTEGNVFRNALLPDIQNPLIITDSCIYSGLTACTYFLDIIIQIWFQIQSAEKRRSYNGLVLDRQRLEDGQPKISHLLVLHGTADEHIVIPVSPIRRHTLLKAVNPLGEKIEIQILPLAYHLPALLSPLVRIFQ